MSLWKRLFGKHEPAPAPFSGPQAGWVSVWVADFTQELNLDGYSAAELGRDHGVVAFPGGAYSVFPAPRPMEDLLRGQWLSKRWAEAMLAICREKGIREAPCCVWRVHYRHVPAREGVGPLRFVGCVPLST
jgi:hypothetical protein